VIHQISYTDPNTQVTYTLAYEEDDPATMRLSRQGDGILFPVQALDYLLTIYEQHVVHDFMEHRPVRE
jgi:hypothetical protein